MSKTTLGTTFTIEGYLPEDSHEDVSNQEYKIWMQNPTVEEKQQTSA